MAGFRMHVGVAASMGVGYGYGAMVGMGFGPDAAALAAAVTAAGGMLPDLDSESGRPVREVFGLAAAVVPVLLVPRLQHAGLTHEAILAALVGCYLAVRYGAPWVLGQLTVHRGMFHSLPALAISGLAMYLEYGSPDRRVRLLLAGGVMLGFLSHLVLDEIYSVDFNGVRLKLKSSAGTALKLFSDSVWGTTCCYAILGALLYTAYLDWTHVPAGEPPPTPLIDRR